LNIELKGQRRSPEAQETPFTSIDIPEPGPILKGMLFPLRKRSVTKTFCHGLLSMLLLITMGHWPMDSLCGEEDPYVAELEIEGFPPIVLSELPLISNETEVIEVKDEKDTIISKRPGKTRYSNIVLVMDLDLFPDQLRNWRQETIEGVFSKRWGVVTIRQRETGKVKIQHIFYEGWPSKLTHLYKGGKFFIHYEIAANRIQSKKFPLVPE
jgi:hypothetical protein